MPLDLPRRYKVTYASSMAGEIRKNVQLEPGEEVVYWCAVQVRTNWLLMQPGVLQLTPRRLIVVEHHAFSADWILEIPPAAIVNVTAAGDSGSDWTIVTFSSGTTVETVNLRPLTFRGRPSPERSGVLFDALRAFHSGELSRNIVANSEKQHELAAGPPPNYSLIVLLALLCAVLFVRAGIYVAKLPEQWRAKQTYDASSDCNQARLLGQTQLDRRGPQPGQPSVVAPASAFCVAQTMTVLRVWNTRNAGHRVDLMDASGKAYYDIDGVHSVNAHLWWRMQPGVKVDVLLAGDRPAWISHDGNLFETRQSPDHTFWEHSFLMLDCLFFCALTTAITAFVLRRAILMRRHATLAQGVS